MKKGTGTYSASERMDRLYRPGLSVEGIDSGRKQTFQNRVYPVADPAFDSARVETILDRDLRVGKDNRKGLKYSVGGLAILMLAGSVTVAIISDYSSKLDKASLGRPVPHIVTVGEVQDPLENLIKPCADRLGVGTAVIGKYMNDESIKQGFGPVYFSELVPGQEVDIPEGCKQK